MKGYPRWDDDSEDKKDGEEKEAEGDTPDTSSFSGHLMYLALGFPLDKRRSEESRHEAAKEQLGRFVGRYRSGEGAGLTIAL
ncbi:MAG: hypothetical protein Q8P50_10960 [Bacillota bacterium]|nr:hypothetical protein [Bacillota bacterium]